MSRPTLRRTTGSVFAPVTVGAFSSAQVEACEQFLSARVADTECIPIVDERQLIMGADGRVLENGYRFNAIGFSAVCGALIGGLSSVFNELCGESRNRYAESITNGDLAAAVAIYNTALRARFELLQERTLLVNHADKTIDGFLGIEHRMLDNLVFFNLITEELRTQQPDSSFYRAEISGRELRLYFVHNGTKRNDLYFDTKHTFAAGWFFSNREDAGLAIRAAQAVLTKFGAAVPTRKKSSTLRHVGADLLGRTVELIQKATKETVSSEQLARGVARLQSMSLNFAESKNAFDAAFEHWLTYLTRFKIPLDVAKTVCRSAAFSGADLQPQDAVNIYSKQSASSRTMYDLFCALLKVSRTQYASIKDTMQNAAFEMLFLLDEK